MASAQFSTQIRALADQVLVDFEKSASKLSSASSNVKTKLQPLLESLYIKISEMNKKITFDEAELLVRNLCYYYYFFNNMIIYKTK